MIYGMFQTICAISTFCIYFKILNINHICKYLWSSKIVNNFCIICDDLIARDSLRLLHFGYIYKPNYVASAKSVAKKEKWPRLVKVDAVIMRQLYRAGPNRRAAAVAGPNPHSERTNRNAGANMGMRKLKFSLNSCRIWGDCNNNKLLLRTFMQIVVVNTIWGRDKANKRSEQ